MLQTTILLTLPLNFFSHQEYIDLARILAIDFGRKRTGVAVTDPMQIIANGLETVPSKDIFSFLKDYMSKEQVETIVVGYPKQMDNTGSESLRYINPFLRKLEKEYPEMHIELYDERFTSKLAHQAMRDGGLKKKKRQDKALVDTISATIILQSYMERKSNLGFNF